MKVLEHECFQVTRSDPHRCIILCILLLHLLLSILHFCLHVLHLLDVASLIFHLRLAATATVWVVVLLLVLRESTLLWEPTHDVLVLLDCCAGGDWQAVFGVDNVA